MYPDYRQPQVFNRRKFRYREEMVHEGFDLDGSDRLFSKRHLAASLADHGGRHRQGNRYTTLMARRRLGQGRRARLLELTVHPAAAFLKKYLLHQGFRDGMPGFLIAVDPSALHFHQIREALGAPAKGRARPLAGPARPGPASAARTPS